MNETYNNLKELASLYRGTEKMEDIAIAYQDSEDAILLSYVYCTNIGLIFTQSEKYFGLNPEDVDSYALEELHKAMMHFKSDGGAKLTTLYSRFLNNRLRTETQSNSYDKRKSNTKADSYEQSISEDDTTGRTNARGELKLSYEETSFTEIELLLSLSGKQELSANEYKYCEIIVKEVSDLSQISNTEIAERLEISSAAVHYIKKSLQKKIAIRTNNNYAINI